MSDFLGRLAERAIGAETALAPRLPSLFEPLQRAPIISLSEDGEVPARRHDTAAEKPVTPRAPLAPSARAAEPVRRNAVGIAPVERAATSATAPAAASPRDVAQPLPVVTAPVHPAVVERSVSASTPMQPAVARLPTVQPRQTRVAPDRHEATRLPPIGSLLPAPAPVFATPPVVSPSARSGSTAAIHARAAQAGNGSQASGEPVVHVSIGRLEVRAAPATAAPPRRRDGPQPGSLDDYLRQRGGKATP